MDNAPKLSGSSSSSFLPKKRLLMREKRMCRAQGTPNFIAKNIREASLVRKIEYDDDNSDHVSSVRSSIDSGRSKRCSRSRISRPNRGNDTVDSDYASNNPVALESEDTARASSPKRNCLRISERERTSESSNQDNTSKYYIKQTTCPACMQKWRQPMPSPKTPRVKKSSIIPSSAANQLVKTDSKVRINELIHKEKCTLESYERKFSSDSSRRSSIKKEDLGKDSVEYVKVDILELARQRQEDRERETQKKLEKFLNAPI